MLEILEEQSEFPSSLIEKFVLHPAATQDIRRRVLVDLAKPEQLKYLLYRLLKQKDIRSDPAIRPRLVEAVLATSTASDVRRLLEDANPADCAILFRKLTEISKSEAGRVLADHGERLAPYLTSRDLHPLLTHKNREIRLATIAIAHLVQRRGTAEFSLSLEPQGSSVTPEHL